MDLSFRAIHNVVHPTAAFSPDASDDNDDNDDNNPPDDIAAVDWSQSQLNPRNRIDSLAPMARPLWRIDGCAGLGTQFYAYPLFLDEKNGGGPPPMHIDVFVREAAAYPRVLRDLLDLDVAFHTKDAARVRRLGIAQHLVRILHWHTLHGGNSDPLHPDAVARLYRDGPFGSRIVVEDLACHVHATRIVVSPNYPLESDLVSYAELVSLWGLDRDLPASAQLPPEISIDRVHLVRQLHDSISEVYVDDGADQKLLVLKSLTSGVKYMYQEMRALLCDIPPHHPSVLARPLHIVSKQCLFGRKRGVVGFTMPLLAASALRDALPLLRIQGRLHGADQLRWARQITEALCHVWHGCSHNQSSPFFYPDLRLDNVLLTAPAPHGDAGLVDFEQRGVWSGFSAPEVDHLENMRILAFDDPGFDFAVPEEVSLKYRQILVDCYEAATVDASIKSTKPLILRLEEETKYSNPAVSYNVSWACLTAREQEAAMVYMLGRLLWCIFEGVSAPHPGAVWQSYPREPDLEFPAFRHASPEQRSLVLKCFGEGGAREQSKLVRCKSKLYMKQTTQGGLSYELVGDGLVDKARRYWQEQVAESEAWLQARNERLIAALKENGNNRTTETENISAYGRPTLKVVLSWIKELEGRQG